MQKSSFSHFYTPIATPSRMADGEKLIYTDRSSVLLPRDAVRGLHYHELCEVGICRKGSGLWFIGDCAYALSPGDAVVVPAGVAHYSRSVGIGAGGSDKSDCRCDFIYFDEAKLFSQCGISEPEGAVKFPAVFTRRENEELRAVLESMVDAVILQRERGTSRELSSRIAAHWYALFLLLQSQHSPSESMKYIPAAKSELTPALEKMLVAFTEPLNLDLLASECAMSTSWFLKQFGREFGTSPMRYLNRIRVSVASQLLLGSELSVTEIAGYVGFTSPSELYRHFHSIFGMSPIEYRKLKG